METEAATVFGWVDTHTHTHYAAAVHQHGRLRGHREFPATDRGDHSSWPGCAGHVARWSMCQALIGRCRPAGRVRVGVAG
jgi:hypothetical protein